MKKQIKNTVATTFILLLVFSLFPLTLAQEEPLAGAEEQIDELEEELENVEAGIAPGEFGYGMDKFFENIGYALSFDKETKGLKIAEECLEELKETSQEGDVENAERAKECHEKMITRVKARVESNLDDSDGDEDDLITSLKVETALALQEAELQELRDRLADLTPAERRALLALLLEHEGSIERFRGEIEDTQNDALIRFEDRLGKSRLEIRSDLDRLREEKRIVAEVYDDYSLVTVKYRFKHRSESGEAVSVDELLSRLLEVVATDNTEAASSTKIENGNDDESESIAQSLEETGAGVALTGNSIDDDDDDDSSNSGSGSDRDNDSDDDSDSDSDDDDTENYSNSGSGSGSDNDDDVSTSPEDDDVDSDDEVDDDIDSDSDDDDNDDSDSDDYDENEIEDETDSDDDENDDDSSSSLDEDEEEFFNSEGDVDDTVGGDHLRVKIEIEQDDGESEAEVEFRFRFLSGTDEATIYADIVEQTNALTIEQLRAVSRIKEENDVADDTDRRVEVKVRARDNGQAVAEVRVEWDGLRESFIVASTDRAEIIAEIAARYGAEESEIESALSKFEVRTGREEDDDNDADDDRDDDTENDSNSGSGSGSDNDDDDDVSTSPEDDDADSDSDDDNDADDDSDSDDEDDSDSDDDDSSSNSGSGSN